MRPAGKAARQYQSGLLGTFNAWLFKPSWLIEGMVYSMSADPRKPLPQPLQSWRDSFEQWRLVTRDQDIWEAARAVR